MREPSPQPSPASWRGRRFATIVACLLAVAAFAAPEARGARDERRITIAATGDLLLHQKVVAAARAHGWANVLEALHRTHDPRALTFLNLETPLADDVRPLRTGSPPVLGAPSEVAAALAEAGVDVVACANNHAWDQGSVGLARTLAALARAGVAAVGASTDAAAAFEPTTIQWSGLRVGFVSFADGLNRGPGETPPSATVALLTRPHAIEEAVAKARAENDVVVVALHFTGDFVPRPRRDQLRLIEDVARRGADLVLVTGPHILHPLRRIARRDGTHALAALSLGNVLSNQGQRYRVGRAPNPNAHRAVVQPATRDGVLLRVTLRANGRRAAIERVEGIPLWTETNFLRWERGDEPQIDIRVRRLADVDASTRIERGRAIARALGNEVRLVPSVLASPSR